MKQISVLIPEPYLQDMDLLVEQKVYPNRAELVRLAIRDLLRQHGLAAWPEEKLKNE